MKRPLWWPHLNVWELKFSRSTLDLPADVPPSQLNIDALHTITPNLVDLPPQSIEHKCLAYHCTKLGRSTPWSIEHRCLAYHYAKLGRSTPWSIEHRCLAYCYTKLDRSTPQPIEHRCLEYHYTKLGRSADRTTPHQLSIDALNTVTPNLADLLAELSPTSAMHHGIYIMGCIWQPFWILQERWEFLFISE